MTSTSTARITISDDYSFVHLHVRAAADLDAYLRRFLARSHADDMTRAGEVATLLLLDLNERDTRRPRAFVDTGSTAADERYLIELTSLGWRLMEPQTTGAFG